MIARKYWLSAVLMLALAACGKPAAEETSATKQGNDPAEAGAADIEAKTNADVKAKIATIEAASEKEAVIQAAPPEPNEAATPSTSATQEKK